MKVIIAGSRTIQDDTLKIIDDAVKESTFNIETLVCGMARGVDMMGFNWAKNNKISIKEFPADWNKYGKKAGYLRNVEMGNYADCLIAIWDGESKGTKTMIEIMKNLNKPFFIKLLETNNDKTK